MAIIKHSYRPLALLMFPYGINVSIYIILYHVLNRKWKVFDAIFLHDREIIEVVRLSPPECW